MNTFLWYWIYGCIVFYIIEVTRIVFLRILKYILRAQEAYGEAVVSQATTMDIFNSHQGLGRRHRTTLFTTCSDGFKT